MNAQRPWSLLLAVAVLGAAGACYSPSLIDCTIACGSGGGCPSDTRCGPDLLCHIGPLDECVVELPDGAIVPRPPDAPRPAPDAPSACDGVGVGEPDDTCPGERVGPVVEGKTIVMADHRLYPARDVDVYQATVKLDPITSCPATRSVSYALRVQIEPPQGASDMRLRRFDSDRTCGGSTSKAGLAFCLPFAVFCSGPPAEPPVFYFAVDQAASGPGVCQPYTLAVQVCAAGSTCDNCRTR